MYKTDDSHFLKVLPRKPVIVEITVKPISRRDKFRKRDDEPIIMPFNRKQRRAAQKLEKNPLSKPAASAFKGRFVDQ